ncbi:MAG: hypothetical protein WDZ48_04155 [Pirellulales bacterium]
MAALVSILQVVVGVGSLVCFIMVIIQMFQHGDTTVAIASLVLLLCFIGGLIAFVYGWMKAAEWNITNVMLAWTGCIVGALVLGVLQYAVAAPG